MRYAVIENEKVVNIVLSSPEFAAEQGWVECPDEVNIGWDYKNDTLIQPAITDSTE